VFGLCLEGRCLVDLSYDLVAGENQEHTEQERDPPAPGLEVLLGMIADNGRNTAAAGTCPTYATWNVKLP